MKTSQVVFTKRKWLNMIPMYRNGKDIKRKKGKLFEKRKGYQKSSWISKIDIQQHVMLAEEYLF